MKRLERNTEVVRGNIWGFKDYEPIRLGKSEKNVKVEARYESIGLKGMIW